MTAAAASVSAPSGATGLLIMDSGEEVCLCPFFGKCDGLLLIDPESGLRHFHVNPGRKPEAMCDLILSLGISRLVIGFIADSPAAKLKAAGVDIRLGECCSPVEDLALHFTDLPRL